MDWRLEAYIIVSDNRELYDEITVTGGGGVRPSRRVCDPAAASGWD